MAFLPENIHEKYIELKEPIRNRLEHFKNTPEKGYFYELCYCICTPQTKAASALIVQSKLEDIDFFNQDINPVNILREPAHYIRFHNEKSKRLVDAKNLFPDIIKIIHSEIGNIEKRDWLARNFKGIGMKESSHFLRNIGFTGLTILDRHIFKHLKLCEVIEDIPKSINFNKYKQIEHLFLQFSEEIGIPIDELDLLFWSYETGSILK